MVMKATRILDSKLRDLRWRARKAGCLHCGSCVIRLDDASVLGDPGDRNVGFAILLPFDCESCGAGSWVTDSEGPRGEAFLQELRAQEMFGLVAEAGDDESERTESDLQPPH